MSDGPELTAAAAQAAAADHWADVWVALPGAFGRDLARSGGGALLAAARRLADELVCRVEVVLAEAEAAATAIAYGADRAHVTTDFSGYLARQQPEFVLLPAGAEALAAGLAQQWGAGLVTGTHSLAIEPDTRALLAAHPVYGGEYALGARLATRVKLATVQTAGLPDPRRDAGRGGPVAVDEHEAPPGRVRDLGAADYQPPAWRPLEKARVIVSVGRGVQDVAGVALAAALAERLGAELAGDRSARDMGWVDAAHEVGVTAREVAPELYVAVGVLGDTIHNAAIAGAGRVVAIHANLKAPIFAMADVAVAGDVKEVLRALLKTAAG